MKPSHATVETLSKHIMRFETSKASDRIRGALHDACDRIKRVGRSLHSEEGDVAFVALLVRHRELRRAARTMAKMALHLQEQLDASHVEHDALITRILKLEAEIDRLNTKRNEPDASEIHCDTQWARDFLEKTVLHGRTKAFSGHIQQLSKAMSDRRAGRLTAAAVTKDLSQVAGRFAEQIRALIEDKTIGVSVALTTAQGEVAIASNVDPRALGAAVGMWVRQVLQDSVSSVPVEKQS